MTSLKLGNGIKNIGDHAFQYCKSLKTLVIPGSVESFGYYVFRICQSLESVTICEGVTALREMMFADCESISTVTIPKSLTTIEISAFSYCMDIKDVYYGGSKADWNRIAIDEENEYLTDANIHFLSDFDDSETVLPITTAPVTTMPVDLDVDTKKPPVMIDSDKSDVSENITEETNCVVSEESTPQTSAVYEDIQTSHQTEEAQIEGITEYKEENTSENITENEIYENGKEDNTSKENGSSYKVIILTICALEIICGVVSVIFIKKNKSK